MFVHAVGETTGTQSSRRGAEPHALLFLALLFFASRSYAWRSRALLPVRRGELPWPRSASARVFLSGLGGRLQHAVEDRQVPDRCRHQGRGARHSGGDAPTEAKRGQTLAPDSVRGCQNSRSSECQRFGACSRRAAGSHRRERRYLRTHVHGETRKARPNLRPGLSLRLFVPLDDLFGREIEPFTGDDEVTHRLYQHVAAMIVDRALSPTGLPGEQTDTPRGPTCPRIHRRFGNVHGFLLWCYRRSQRAVARCTTAGSESMPCRVPSREREGRTTLIEYHCGHARVDRP